MMYEWKGFPSPAKGWRYSKETMAKLDAQGLIWYPDDKTKRPRFKRYLDEMKGVAMGSVWTDIPPLNSQAAERLGYPTQKPLALLERIIKASSNSDDIVLDAFCGCGTAIVAAQRLDRRWIGIDVSPTACRVMSARLEKDCKLRENTDFLVRDMPRNESQLRRIPPFEFQNWAVIAVGGIPNAKKVKDGGIDGRVYPAGSGGGKGKSESPLFDVMGNWYPVQVKQQDKAGRPDIDAFETAMNREKKTKGVFVSFDYTSDAMVEIRRFFKEERKLIVPLTVKEILEAEAEEIAMKLA